MDAKCPSPRPTCGRHAGTHVCWPVFNTCLFCAFFSGKGERQRNDHSAHKANDLRPAHEPQTATMTNAERSHAPITRTRASARINREGHPSILARQHKPPQQASTIWQAHAATGKQQDHGNNPKPPDGANEHTRKHNSQSEPTHALKKHTPKPSDNNAAS